MPCESVMGGRVDKAEELTMGHKGISAGANESFIFPLHVYNINKHYVKTGYHLIYDSCEFGSYFS